MVDFGLQKENKERQMKVQAINTNNYQQNKPSFKGIFYGGHRDFSESQIKVADDIKTKLGKTAEKNDFLIKALPDDIVELSEEYNVKKVGTGINKEIQYSKGAYIGKYDEKHPFELEDYNYAVKEKAKGFRALMFLALVYVATILALMPWKKNNSETVTQQTEKVATIAKDSLQFAKDSLKMLK